MIDYNLKQYKTSRTAYTWYCTFDYFISILITDAYLAKLLTNLGISDAVIGIISSLVTFAFLFKLGALFVMQKITNIKKTCILFTSAYNLLFLLIYLIPFMKASTEIKTALVIGSVILGYCSNYLVMSIIFKWGNSYVDPNHRAEFSANKEMVSLIMGMAFTFIVGHVIDRYESIGNVKGGFIFISCAIFIIALCNFISLMKIKSGMGDGEIIKPDKTPIREVVSHILENKAYKSLCVLTILFDVSRYMVIGYLGVYKTKDLLLSVGFVQIINIIANLFRFILSKPIGKFSDKFSYARGVELGVSIFSVGLLFLTFCSPDTWWIIIIYTILYNVSIAGTNQNLSNITYDYIENKYFVQASAIKSALGGIFGFSASLVAGKILSMIQASGNTVLGIHIYGQQFLAVIAFIFSVITVLYLHFVVAKQKKTS